MSLNRRQFLLRTTGTVIAGTAVHTALAGSSANAPYKAILFDAFPIFDPRPVAKRAEALFGTQSVALMSSWRTRQFEYQWLHALSRRYVDFQQATRDSLIFAARQTGISLDSQARDDLLGAYANLTVWPDVPEVLPRLRKAGFRLGILSNMTLNMLEAGLHRAGLDDLFDHVLSTDRIRTYKPAPAAYQLGIDSFRLQRQRILFVPSAGWDTAGARWFGYPTFWVNRLQSPVEELDALPDGTGADLGSLASFVLNPSLVPPPPAR